MPKRKPDHSQQWIMLLSVGIVIVLVVLSGAIGGWGFAEKEPVLGQPNDKNPTTNNDIPEGEPDDYFQEIARRQPTQSLRLSCDGVAAFGADNTASILITNRSGRFLEYAELDYQVDGTASTFIISNLPAGESVWVLESDGVQANDKSAYIFVDGISNYLDAYTATSEALDIKINDGRFKVLNLSERTLENVIIYYRTRWGDGCYWGGEGNVLHIGTLLAGNTIERIAENHTDSKMEIVRIEWLYGES